MAGKPFAAISCWRGKISTNRAAVVKMLAGKQEPGRKGGLFMRAERPLAENLRFWQHCALPCAGKYKAKRDGGCRCNHEHRSNQALSSLATRTTRAALS